MLFETFKLSQLEKYKSLAWDIDDTLIGNNHSDTFGRYILEHPQQTHIIITHRCAGLEDAIQDDFALWQHEDILYSKFTDIFSVPYELWAAYKFYRNPIEKQKAENAYFEWKGNICKEFGIQALIDDNIEHCYPGCKINGIDFYYSFGLTK